MKVKDLKPGNYYTALRPGQEDFLTEIHFKCKSVKNGMVTTDGAFLVDRNYTEDRERNKTLLKGGEVNIIEMDETTQNWSDYDFQELDEQTYLDIFSNATKTL